MKNAKRKLLIIFLPLLVSAFDVFAYDLIVAKDGSGNFTTIQAAIDAAPTGRTVAFTILIKNGKYKEVVTIPSSKPFVHLIGESVAGTIITYDNYSGKFIPGGGGATYGTSNSATVFFNANDCAAYNISMENSTGYTGDGPQALAINVSGDRCVFKNCRFNSGQDTIYTGGGGKRNYFRNCYIDGNTDFIFGASISLFDSCIVYGRDRVDGGTGGIITAANTPTGQTYGYVFKDCAIPASRGITKYTLGRPWQNGCPGPPSAYNKVVFLNSIMSASVSAVGWQTWDACTVTSQVYYGEYKSKYFGGGLVDVSQRPAWTFQLTDAEAASYTTSNLFGTWDPCTSWTDLCTYAPPELVVSNFKVQRGGSNSLISWNISWKMSYVTYGLYRSTDSINFSLISTLVSSSDTVMAFSQTDGLPAPGTKYFYYLKASKTGQADYNSEVAVVNVNVPLNGEFRSANSGPWSNNVTATATITSGQVTAVAVAISPSGYTSAPTVTFAAAPAGGTTATGTAILTGGVVTGVNIVSAGAGYIAVPAITFSTAGVGGTSVWESYNATTSSWSLVALGTGPSNVSVSVRNGHTVSLNVLAGVSNLTIESGATLNSISNALQGATQTIRVGNGTAPVTAFITNDGVFGSTSGTNDGIVVEAAAVCKTLSITGNGTTSIARFRPLPPNLNNFNFVIDQHMDFNMSNNVGLTGYYNNASNSNAEAVTITINPNKMVRVTQPGGGFHTSATTSNQQGTIVYRVNGTLDLSATNSIAMVPSSVNAVSAVTMNIGAQGIFKTGGTLTMTNTAGTSYGSSRIVVDTGGIFDAVKTTTLTATNNSNSGYVVLNGGVLRRAAGNTNVIFPVAPATAVPSYNPVTINNAGLPDKFAVNVKTDFDQPVPDATKAVSRQWIISEDTANGSNATISLAWSTDEQGAAFNPANPVSIIRYNGTAWDPYPATISGAGTAANPYVATATGITSFSLFGIVNTSGPLPLKVISFKAAYITNQVQTAWITTDEINTKAFQIERSADARTFAAIGNVSAANRAGTNNYQFTDIVPFKGISYYRLKMLDKDGAFTYSLIAVVNAGASNASLLLYPNPVKNQVQVQHKAADMKSFVEIYSAEGKMLLRKRVAANVQQTFVDMSAFAAGTYTLRYTNDSEQSNIHFTKQ
ncbi:MAG: pectinesterase family protein [Ferruginibacter sp.]